MVKQTYLKRFGKKLAQRDEGWKCHHCNADLIPIDATWGERQYFDYAGYTLDVWTDTKYHQYVRKPQYRQASVDHIICRSAGGTDELANLVLACHQCNTERHKKSYEDFLAMKRGRQS